MTGKNQNKSLLRPAVFLDRDGVVVRYKRLLTHKEDLELLPHMSEVLLRLHEAGYVLVLITNQSVVARGLITEEELTKLHEYLQTMLAESGVQLDAIYYCPHHPNAEVERYRTTCACRKPNTLLIERATEELRLDLSKSFLIGDEDKDIQAGTKAGVKTIFLSTDTNPTDSEPTFIAGTLLEAESFISMNS